MRVRDHVRGLLLRNRAVDDAVLHERGFRAHKLLSRPRAFKTAAMARLRQLASRRRDETAELRPESSYGRRRRVKDKQQRQRAQCHRE